MIGIDRFIPYAASITDAGTEITPENAGTLFPVESKK
jgi:hypothetical protein